MPEMTLHNSQAQQALQRLLEGNARYSSAHAIHPDQDMKRLHDIAAAQHPFATILGCSDSRVPPSLVFDQGLGDLFIVRVAGNITDDAVIASIEYSVMHLEVALVMVLGHTHCGAVGAALESLQHPEENIGHLASVLEPIIPLCREASQHCQGEPVSVEDVVRRNVLHVVKQLQDSRPILHSYLQQGKIAVIGAIYDVDSGHVQLLPSD